MDLASVGVGGEVVFCNDEFFAPASDLLKNTDPEWREHEYTERGKWMDGWETRRRREPGHDWCVIRLGIPGRVQRVTVDTSFFTGNFPESFSLQGASLADDHVDDAEWVELLGITTLAGDSVETYGVSSPYRVTHLRLNIHPDGGIARFRVEGEPIPELGAAGEEIDLANALVGGKGVAASDAHYSSPSNLVRPTEPVGMWDGWETRRRRGPGHDWAIVTLGLPGMVRSVDVDTRHFKGNPPGWVALHVSEDGTLWDQVVGRHPVSGHEVNHIGLNQPVHAGQVRLNIYPDGGVARLRVWGIPDAEPTSAMRVVYLDSLFPEVARHYLSTACGSGRWVDDMMGARPFGTKTAVFEAADAAFDGMSEEDWLEAFGAHPRIGERIGNQPPWGEAMSSAEQDGVSDTAQQELRHLNESYEQRFGFTYIVRATGRSGEEMADLARKRLDNDRDTEIGNAADQQREITRLRLQEMLGVT